MFFQKPRGIDSCFKDLFLGMITNIVSITNNYNEWLTYDKNGNILALGRNGISDFHNNIIQMDYLTYDYASNYSSKMLDILLIYLN